MVEQSELTVANEDLTEDVIQNLENDPDFLQF